MITNISRLISLFAVICAANAQAKLTVLSSIKPLTLIAQEISGEYANTDTLLPVTASPHDYPLKVSDYSRLQKADLILWVGPELESFLYKPLSNLPEERVITAYDLQGINWPAVEGHSDRESHHHERDPHIWLDPRNAVTIAHALSDQLVRLDPLHKEKYLENLQSFTFRMTSLDKDLSLKLKPVANSGFAVYHEGYGHFVNHYGLNQLGYVTFTPEQRSGAKHLQQLREKLGGSGNCLFLEPYYEQQSVKNLAKELKLNTGILDALGSDKDIRQYSQLLGRMADAFVACLSRHENTF